MWTISPASALCPVPKADAARRAAIRQDEFAIDVIVARHRSFAGGARDEIDRSAVRGAIIETLAGGIARRGPLPRVRHRRELRGLLGGGRAPLAAPAVRRRRLARLCHRDGGSGPRA